MLINKNRKNLLLRLGFGYLSLFIIATWDIFTFQTPGITGTSQNPDFRNEIRQSPSYQVDLRSLKSDILLISDIDPGDPSISNLDVLYPGRITATKVDGTDVENRLNGRVKKIMLLMKDPAKIGTRIQSKIENFVSSGGEAFLDLRSYSTWRSLETGKARGDIGKIEKELSTREQMKIGIKVQRETNVTKGFRKDQIAPWFGENGEHLYLMIPEDRNKIEVLGTSSLNGKPMLIQERIGKGRVVAVDMLSLEEPFYRNVGGFCKYLFLGNLIGETVRYGEYYSEKLKYPEFVKKLKEVSEQFPRIKLINEGEASGGYDIYSLNIGDLSKPVFFFYAMVHGSEWEPGYGLITFAKFIVSHTNSGALDLRRFSVKIIPCMNPWGYDRYRRQNANGVDLNRNISPFWDNYTGLDTNQDGIYGPWDFDWKGKSPSSEPETKIYKKICDCHNIFCILDFHGNANARYNKMGVLPVTGKKENSNKAKEFQKIFNDQMKDRYVLRQNSENGFSQYILKSTSTGGSAPFLLNYGAKGRYGVLIETSAGYPDSYGTIMQTDFVTETCLAAIRTYSKEH